MSTLVYVGANEGVSLWGLIEHFDEVHVFEPDPEIFAKLKKRYKQFEWVTLNNAACSDKDGESSFFVLIIELPVVLVLVVKSFRGLVITIK